MDRPSWDEYFIEIAQNVAKRSTCLRRKVGCIIVKNKKIISTGYNGAVSGLIHCNERGCLRDKMNILPGKSQELCWGLHAEQNALLFTITHGVSLSNAALYCTHQPCILCAKMIVQAGIKKVIFCGSYPDKLALDIFHEANVKSQQVDLPLLKKKI
ncbi:cytidine/deoxycytidylate deaminase family protein [bacterium]|nr:cytidine/deoxycytidylate deaminase family protein [bacterium]